MKLLLKVLALIVLGPIALVLLLVLAIVGMVALPLAWERAVAHFTAPKTDESSAGPTTV